jgi:hypothetical protein
MPVIAANYDEFFGGHAACTAADAVPTADGKSPDGLNGSGLLEPSVPSKEKHTKKKASKASDVPAAGSKTKTAAHTTDAGATLRVLVKGAQHLPKPDALGTCDPYAVLSLGGQKHQTKVVSNSQEPAWEEELVFSVSQPFGDEALTADVLSFDRFVEHDYIGSAVLPLQSLWDVPAGGHGEAVERQLPLRNARDAASPAVLGQDDRPAVVTLVLSLVPAHGSAHAAGAARPEAHPHPPAGVDAAGGGGASNGAAAAATPDLGGLGDAMDAKGAGELALAGAAAKGEGGGLGGFGDDGGFGLGSAPGGFGDGALSAGGFGADGFGADGFGAAASTDGFGSGGFGSDGFGAGAAGAAADFGGFGDAGAGGAGGGGNGFGDSGFGAGAGADGFGSEGFGGSAFAEAPAEAEAESAPAPPAAKKKAGKKAPAAPAAPAVHADTDAAAEVPAAAGGAVEEAAAPAGGKAGGKADKAGDEDDEWGAADDGGGRSRLTIRIKSKEEIEADAKV